MKKVLLLCHFSNEELRSHIDQAPLKRANSIRRLLKRPDVPNVDAAPWVPTFVEGIRKFGKDVELHVVTSCVGMKYPRQDYMIGGVKYHIFNYDLPWLYKLCDKIFNITQQTHYRIYRKRISAIIRDVHPELIVLSGAENPEYSSAVLDHLNIPSFVILQTLLSSPKRIKLNVGTPYRRKMEQEIFTKCSFFTASEDGADAIIKRLNPNAICFDFEFSTLPPPIFTDIEKKYDFVFVSGALTKFKGVEDTIRAFGLFCKEYPHSTLDIIGFAREDYLTILYDIVKESNVEGKVFFEGRYPDKDDMFKQVQKARIMVVPGITATLNTTVREGMFMGMPVLQYETSVCKKINKEKPCLAVAKMEDISDLASQMKLLYENPVISKQMADNGQEYANRYFTAEAVGKMLANQIEQVFKIIEKDEQNN